MKKQVKQLRIILDSEEMLKLEKKAKENGLKPASCGKMAIIQWMSREN